MGTMGDEPIERPEREEARSGEAERAVKEVGSAKSARDADAAGDVYKRQGFACTQAFSGSEGRLLLSGSEPFDLVITDLMLPGMAGEDVVRLVRARGDMPVIVMSARTTAADKVALLKLGADDYLTKPFDLDELLARVQVQLRHADVRRASASGAPSEDVYKRQGGGRPSPGCLH